MCQWSSGSVLDCGVMDPVLESHLASLYDIHILTPIALAESAFHPPSDGKN